jgi:Lrp/AsnC family transcriptional regulator, leucine-responsive regulatory protein
MSLTSAGERLQLDATDYRILKELQKDGRVSNLELSRRVNLSPTPCLTRVKRLEAEGVITGYAAFVSPEKLDVNMLVFAEVVLDRTTEEVFERFGRAVCDMPQVMECHMVSGGFDYLIKARVRDMADYREFLGKSLVDLPSVRETHTYVVMEEVKCTTAIPVPARGS